MTVKYAISYQAWIEKRAAKLAEFMKANDMTTTMLLEAVVELCAQQGIDAGDRVEAEMTYAEWRKEDAIKEIEPA